MTVLAYGTMVYVALTARRRSRHRCRSDRSPNAASGRYRHHHSIRREDRPLRDRARGDAHQRLWRGTFRAGAGELLLPSRSADPAGHAAGIRPIRTPSSGSIFRDRSASPPPCAARWRVETMGTFVFKLPDVGEGTAEAEIVAWHVKVGDVVEEDQNLVDVMTDKATVEMTAPVAGKVIALHGEPRCDGAGRCAAGRVRSRRRRQCEGRNGKSAAPAKPDASKADAPPAPKAEAKPAAATRGAAEGRRRNRPPQARLRHARRRATSRWPRRRCASARMNSASNCNSCRARARRAASPTPISTALSRAAGEARPLRSGLARARGRRGGQGHRPAPQDRREDAGLQAPHPALRLCRRGRHDRAGKPARPSQRHEDAGAAQAHRAALLHARAGEGAAATIRRSMPASTTRPAWSIAMPRSISASPRRRPMA